VISLVFTAIIISLLLSICIYYSVPDYQQCQQIPTVPTPVTNVGICWYG